MNLEIKNGNFSYTDGNPILKDINLKIESGEIFTILGQNGIGKTTLLKCINGVLKWNSGEVFIDNKKVNSIKDLKDIAYVPQAHSFSFSYTVRELSIMGRAKYLNIFSTPSKSDYDIVEKVLDEMGILHLKDRKCSELSGGQLQLVFLARALVGEPKILILDEPESHLDFKNQTKILRTIVQLAKKKNITCIFNTHYPEYALRISDKSMLIGKDDYIIGKTSEIINEETLKKYFEITIILLIKKVQEEYGMLDKEQIKKILRLASKEVKDYFGDKNVKLRAFESDYNTEVGLYPHIRYLIYKSWEIKISIVNLEYGGVMSYAVNIGDYYNLRSLVPYAIAESRISFNDSSEDIKKSLEVLDEYLIWRMTDAQKKTFGIPLDKEVLKED